jgi:hypothetical protein
MTVREREALLFEYERLQKLAKEQPKAFGPELERFRKRYSRELSI